MPVKRVVISDGDSLPCHRDNILDAEEIKANPKSRDGAKGVVFENKLAIWYYEPENEH